MTTRSVSIVLLFFAALAATGLCLALMLSLAPTIGIAPGRWMLPVAALVAFTAVFFLGRDVVLPAPYARSALKALGVLTIWMAATIFMWQTVMWVLRPIMGAIGVSSGQLFVLLGCLLVSVRMLERIGARKTGRLLP